jgi:hypothetical protein
MAGGMRLTACLAFLLPALCLADASMPGSVGEIIGGVPFTPEQVRAVAAGKVVATPVVPVAEGELAIGLACLTSRDAAEPVLRMPVGQWLVPEEHVIGSGVLEPAGGDVLNAAVDRFVAGSEAARYARAKPGAELNLSPYELEKIGVAAGGGIPGTLAVLVRDLLLTRHADYRTAGVSALAPYDRGKGSLVDPGSQLRQSAEESYGIAAYFPSTHETLLRYPEMAEGVADGGFHWILTRLGDRDAVVLTHTLSAHRGETDVVVTRAYYVSHSLDALQAVTVVHPVTEGTLFLYVYRAWLDRIRGFAGSIAAGIAREIMTRKMQELARETGACTPRDPA